MKPEQQRVSCILLDTVTLLCRNSLTFSKGMKIQGLIGITTDDDDVFLVHINEIIETENSSTNETLESTQSSVPLRAVVKRENAEMASFVPRSQDGSETTRPAQYSNKPPLKKAKLQNPQVQVKSEQLGYSETTNYDGTFSQYPTGFGELDSGESLSVPYAVHSKKITYGGAGSSAVSSTVVTESYMVQGIPEFSQMEMFNDGLKDEGLWQQNEGDYMYDPQENINETADYEEWDTSTIPQAPQPARSHGKQTFSSGGGGRGRGGAQKVRQPATAPSMIRSSKPSGPGGNQFVITESSHICGYPSCGKRFRFKHDLLRHQTKKHGRTPKTGGRVRRGNEAARFMTEEDYGYE